MKKRWKRLRKRLCVGFAAVYRINRANKTISSLAIVGLLAVVVPAQAQNCYYDGDYSVRGSNTYTAPAAPGFWASTWSMIRGIFTSPEYWIDTAGQTSHMFDRSDDPSYGSPIGVDHMSGNGSNGRWHSHYK